MPKPKYTLNDFDLLVSRSIFILRQIDELNKERAAVIDDITKLLINANLNSLTTTKGVKVVLNKTLPFQISDLPQAKYQELREWCRNNDCFNINYMRLLNAYNSGQELPISGFESHKYKAYFTNNTKEIDTTIDLVKEQLKSLDIKDNQEARNAHIKDLRRSGLTFAQIRKIYPMSVVHIARICKNRNILPAKPDHKVQVSRQI